MQAETVWTVRSVDPGRGFVWASDTFVAGHTLRPAGAGTMSDLALQGRGLAAHLLRPVLAAALRAENRALADAVRLAA